MRNYIIIAAGLIFSLAACVSKDRQEVKLFGEAQGSTYSITYVDEELRDFQDDIQDILMEIDLSMSLWVDHSLISRINRGETDTLDVHMRRVIQKALSISKSTAGYFDVTVGPLVDAWGFGPDGIDREPDKKELDSILKNVGYKQLTIKDNQLGKSTPNVKIDLNSIAQGYTVDVVSDFLQSQGVYDYMVEIGGEIRTLGQSGRNKPWRIGIDKPVNTESGRPLEVILKLSGESLATSGSYRKFRIEDGIKYSHAINPKTGKPVQHNLLSVTVIAEDCMTADAYATAFLIMGKDAALDYMQNRSMQAFFILEDEEGNLVTAMTGGFERYILESVFE